eukprot:CAMPEP_0172656276 /NCGR_PEP_ID=MMETSP1074-20121228/1261_1 /TAXON_ID=2916 /ORGANISM="Ceratium fusus, Strain PA161109" /LENGTH=362 /DNA_ID=CAMNT_0013471093 /DNA_START=8 /DNA_END=1096 /DNA_ORIENTATION=-
MPLQSGHVFASHIGHTGKTTLCFQTSCFYAKRHPDVHVLVIDFTEEGDLTKRLLGGVDSASKKADDLFGGVFRLLSHVREKTDAGLLSRWLFSQEVDIAQHAIRVADHNPNIPNNLFLMSSGAWPDPQQMEAEARRKLGTKIRDALEQSKTTWKLFCDTDGDRRPSDFTMIAYSLCMEAIVPLHLNKADLDRTETMLGMMHHLREQGEIETQVLFIVWNCVKSLKDEPCSHRGQLGDLGLELPFTPTKVCLSILDDCNAKLYGFSQDLPGLFVHHEAGMAAFIQTSTFVQRQLADNVLKPSEELGMPFVTMVDQLEASGKKSMKFSSGSVEYDTKDSVIHGVSHAMLELEAKMEAMTLKLCR